MIQLQTIARTKLLKGIFRSAMNYVFFLFLLSFHPASRCNERKNLTRIAIYIARLLSPVLFRERLISLYAVGERSET